MTLTKDIVRKVEAIWRAPADRVTALRELSLYGEKAHERETERVCLAILKLCEARPDRLAELVEAAKLDYRDVLAWAEFPSESQALWAVRSDLSPEERSRLERIRQNDRQQYRDWLKK